MDDAVFDDFVSFELDLCDFVDLEGFDFDERCLGTLDFNDDDDDDDDDWKPFARRYSS